MKYKTILTILTILLLPNSLYSYKYETVLDKKSVDLLFLFFAE